MASLTHMASRFGNSDRFMIALLGAGLVAYGSNQVGDKSLTPDQKQMAIMAYSAGWLVLALSVVANHRKHPNGLVEPLSGRSLLAFASALAIITGFSMADAEEEASGKSLRRASKEARMLFVGGWFGLALSVAISSVSPLSFNSAPKVLLALSGVVIGLMGVHAIRPYEVDDDQGDFLGLISSSSEDAWPHSFHYAGLILLAMGIAYHA